MGEHKESSLALSGQLPNGLLPNEAASVMRMLDSERWLKAEERTAELIACIQPNPPSEELRNAIADYVKRLVMKCFPCQVFTFGSVPLKTYLPDGDIDLTVFSENQILKDSWAHQVREMLEKEEKNESAEFHVKEVQYIQAEVKIIKCLVENIVVDISFNQLGGLCTLCFLDEVDTLISQKHLFKRSIILIKAWCYYESRILGAHHGLISTYALETLVLYIFHVFNNNFTGPLEVLYRFLDFFSKFDWDNFCVSLWGPVPISSLPDVTAEPPRKDAGDLLLSKLFLDTCEMVYAVFPTGQENQGQSFVSKHFNVIDPLRVNNNLGRSVSKGNFYRVRGAFAYGAKRLAKLFDCPKDNLFPEVDHFFRNTWERHGSGQRPDAPKNDLWRLRLSSPDLPPGSENHKKKTCSQNQKSYGFPNNLEISEHTSQEISSNHDAQVERVQRSFKANKVGNEMSGRFFFARTRSIPELTDMHVEVSYQASKTRALESERGQISPKVNGGRRSLESDKMVSCGSRTDNSSSAGHVSSDADAAADSNSVSNSYPDDSGSVATDEDFASVTGARMMSQKEQDLFNRMSPSAFHGFDRQVHFPLYLAPGHLPLPSLPSMLASVGYGQRNLGNIPIIETPCGTGMQFPQGLVPPPLSHYFRDVGSASSPEDSIESSNGNLRSAEKHPMQGCEAYNDFCDDWERVVPGVTEIVNGNFEMNHSEDKQLSASGDYNSLASSGAGNLSNSTRSEQNSRENRRSTKEGHVDKFPYENNRSKEVYFDDRDANSMSLPSSASSSLRSKTSFENSWEGSLGKNSKSAREKRGLKNAPSVSSSTNRKAKNLLEISNQEDDENRELNPPSKAEAEFAENNGSESPIHIPGHQVTGFGLAQISGSDPLIPIAPMFMGPASQQRSADDSGVGSYAFYPMGPPVPIFAMLPFCNFPTEAGTSETPTSNFNGERDENYYSQNFDSLEGFDQLMASNSPDSIRRSAAFNLPENNPDILYSDFLSHWKNLQYGRSCQNTRHPPVSFPSPVAVPPVYLPGHFPWDGPGRPLSANMNLFTQLMSYGPHLVPVTPHQTVANRPISVYQRFADEMPRYRSGTGTYLPNTKPAWERRSPSTRRGNYGYDRGDHRADREGNWSLNSKSRSSGHSFNRNQAERQSSRPERLATSESRANRPWGSHRQDASISNQTHNGPVSPNSSDWSC